VATTGRGTWWRLLPGRAARLWRSSLQVRALAITVVMSAIAVTAIGAFMSYSIRGNLFDARRAQLVQISAAAAQLAQRSFDSAVQQGGTAELEAAEYSTLQAVRDAARTPDSGTDFLLERSEGQDGRPLLVDAQEPGFVPNGVITDDLRQRVAESEDRRVFTQSAVYPDGTPALVVAAPIEVQSDRYGLYLVYRLGDVEQSLAFAQRTLVVGSLLLVLLIGGVTFLVSRVVIAPVRVAAQTSERLAAGELDVRLPVSGEDDIARLARSFNRMASSMQQQITRLGTLSQVQQRFVSDVSHELRTPLTTIRLAGDVLHGARADFAPTTARTAELLHDQIVRFETLLADLLEMSRFDAGAVELDIEPTNLVRVVEDVVDALGPLAAEHGSELRVVAPGGYFEAEVDARRVRRILQNLVGNAIDHGEGQPITIAIDSDAKAVALAVRDHGVGMPQEALEHVFERFWRADPSRQRRAGGTGLGLAISSEDAALHGGWLDVWSEPGRGSAFRLTLPRRAGDELRSSPLPLAVTDTGLITQVRDA